MTRRYSRRATDELLKALEDDDAKERTLAVNVLPRRDLSPDQLGRIRTLRDDPKHRPWVRMAALDTLAEIEREKEAQAREKKKKAASSRSESDEP
jgi:hypothetical protein